MRYAPFVLLAAFSVSCFADTLVPGSGEIYLYSAPTSIDAQAAAYSASVNRSANGLDGSVAGSFTGGTDPSVSSQVSSPGTPAAAGVESSSYLWYEFQVAGTSGQTVAINITGGLTATATNLTTASAGANLTVVQPSDPSSPDDGYALATLLNEYACAGSNTAPCGLSAPVASTVLPVDQSLDVLTDTAYVVELYAETNLSGSPGGTALAIVDPTITLAANDTAYSLQFSPGLLPSAATPEPSSLALAATGLLSLGAVLRRRFS